MKGTNLKEGVFDTLFMPAFYFLQRENALFDMFSPQSQEIEFHLIITNQLFDMWPLFNRAGFLIVTCLNAPLTRHIKIGLGFQVSA